MKAIIIEQKVELGTRPKVYELITAQTVKDIDGNDVQIPKSLGRYSLEGLEAQLSDIQLKIKAIKALG